MTKRSLLGCLLLLAIVLAAGLPGSQARADEKEGGAAPGHWVFDVRVVRVDPAAAAGAEAPGPFASMTGATVQSSWPQALGLLKQRGRTTLLLDQSITTMDGVACAAKSDRTVPIVSVNFRSTNDEQLRSTNVKTGCTLELVPEAGMLTYALQVRWSLTPPADEQAPEQFTAEWKGSHPGLDGETLVLRYREQVPARTDEAARAVEIYGLVSGRLVKHP